MNGIDLAAISGVILSLAFSYVPGVSDRFNELEKPEKQAAMGLLLLLVAVFVFSVQCTNLYDFGVVCSTAGAVDFSKILLAALIANQSVYSITKK